jgi:hypothetical protein
VVTETLLPGDAEASAIAELNARLPGLGFPNLPTSTTIPNPRPNEFIRVVAVGGVPSDLTVDSYTLVVEAYASRRGRAERICAFAVAALQAAGREGFMGATPCRRTGVFALPTNLPDPQVPDRFRYSATISADLRRTAA